MNAAELNARFTELLQLPHETEWVEFKEARNGYDFDDLGKYFSALSNESNLKRKPCAWLVFGVQGKPRRIVGSQYRHQRPHLDKLKEEIANHTNNRLTFEEIHEIVRPEGRVVLFQIPPALRGIPTAWKGHYYGRDGEALHPLGLQEIEQIRSQAGHEDWSAECCERAGLNDLDPEAIAFARSEFLKKHPALLEESSGWAAATFLNKAKVCINGRVTRAAIILLGRDEAEHYLAPGIARITWVLKDEHGVESDYEHFGPPQILAVDRLFAKIRNLTYRYMPEVSLFPTELTQYDPWVIRETLHNCIAHQDYTQGGRIQIVESPGSLLFTNVGPFLPGTVEAVVARDAPPEIYPNRLLAEAMVRFNMIDTIGSGIRRMFTKQRQRYFPMPDYDLSESNRVRVTITGKVLDEKYTRVLKARADLDLLDVIALDKVQKRKPITESEFKRLKSRRLIEGRRPNLFVSAEVAAVTATKAEYIKNKAFDKGHYKRMIVTYLEKFREAKREDIDGLLAGKLSDALNNNQKKNVITNLLQEMRRQNLIRPISGKRGKGVRWELHKLHTKDFD